MKDEETNNKSCCPPQEKNIQNGSKNTGFMAVVVGLGAALLASLCCVGPLLAVVLGASGAVALAGLGKYHVYFMAAAVIVLIGGGVLIWRRQKACAVAGQKPKILMPLLLSFAVFGLLTLGINQVFVPYLAATGSGDTSVTTPAGAELHQAVFAIEGMTCEGCSGTIQTVLSRTPGVQKAEVSFEKKEATVVYDAAKTNPQELIAAIGKTQYKASLVKDELSQKSGS